MPRGLNRPWLLTLRPAAISLSRASRHRGERSGRNGRSLRHFSLDHAQGVDEAQSVRIELLLPGGLLHKLAHREVRQQQAPWFLLGLAPRAHAFCHSLKL